MFDEKTYRHAYYLAHKKVICARTKAWRLAHPEQFKLNRRKASALYHQRNKEYWSYGHMMQRCYNIRCKDYKNYGGRGIIVCKRWRGSFVNFRADMGKRPIGFSLDRINNDGNYTPKNCRWADSHTQALNRRPSRFIQNNQFTKGRKQLCLS